MLFLSHRLDRNALFGLLQGHDASCPYGKRSPKHAFNTVNPLRSAL